MLGRLISALITGQSPSLSWEPNPNGEVRSIEQAAEIARRNGVVIPDDVAFFADEYDELNATIAARGPTVTKPVGGSVRWSDLIHDRTGKLPIIVRRDILSSDEAIVAVFAHELHEVAGIRQVLAERRSITIEEFIGYHCPGNPGNLHDEAWAVADAAVRRMRERGES